jgi:hypothetical protein
MALGGRGRRRSRRRKKSETGLEDVRRVFKG